MERTFKWGILGTGNIAHKFAEGLKHVPNSELVAIGSRNFEKAQQFAHEFGLPKAFGSYLELAQCPEVDIVYIATPHNLHCNNTLMCLEYGKNVLCEKPFAVNGKEVRQMIAKAKEKNLFLMEALWSRFLPHVIKAKEIISSGVLGEIRLLKCDFGINFPFNPAHRVYNRELIGGSLLDVGIYPVFLAKFLLGTPKEIKAIAGIGPTTVDNNCSMLFQYENDLMAILYSSIVAQTSVNAEIYGSKGKLIFDQWWYSPVPIRMFDEFGHPVDVPIHFKGNGYNYEAEEVIHCLLENRKESSHHSWKDSLELIDILDNIRNQGGIFYPGHD